MDMMDKYNDDKGHVSFCLHQTSLKHCYSRDCFPKSFYTTLYKVEFIILTINSNIIKISAVLKTYWTFLVTWALKQKKEQIDICIHEGLFKCRFDTDYVELLRTFRRNIFQTNFRIFSNETNVEKKLKHNYCISHL